MGLKGISWFEQNVEKVVVGVFGVALLGVVAMQFVGKGHQVEVGAGPNKRSYDYDEVWGAVGETATATHSRITSAQPDSEVINFDPGAGVYESFTSRLRGSVAPQPRLNAPLDVSVLTRIPGLEGGAERPGAAAEMFAALRAPAPARPTAATYLATIHPQEVMAHPELLKVVAPDISLADLATKPAALLPKLDRAGVSVESTFDGTALEAALLADPDDAGPLSPFPRHWWDSGRVQVLGVELERQELKPDGEWTAGTPVGRMPGRLDLLASVKEMQDGGTIRFGDILQEASRSKREVMQPAYYTIMLGEEWLPPTEVVEDLAAIPEGGDKETRFKRQIGGIDTEIGRLQENIRKIQEESRAPGDPRTPPRQPPPGGGGGKGRTPREGADPGQTRDPKQDRITQLENRIRALLERRQRIIDQAAREGVVLDDAAQPGETPVATTPATQQPELPLFGNSAVRVWSHDISVERGKTYRYRMTLVLNNPLYAKDAALDPKQEALAKDPMVRTAASDWSDPVYVDPQTYYFITSASPEDAFASAARASAEVFSFSMGYWRRGQVNLEPGDTILAEVRVPDPEKIVAMLGVDPNQPMPTPPGIAPPSGPRGRTPIQPGGLTPDRGELPPGRGERPIPVPPQPGEPGTIDPATILVSKTVSEDAMLLDVATTTVVSDQGIAKTKTENQAFLLNEFGKIVVRTPEGDKGTSAYLRLVRSAERGDEALRPRAAVLPGNLQPGTPRPPDAPPPPPGGGGGGGGG